MRKRKKCPKCGGVISLCHVSGPKGEDLGWQYSHAYSFEELLSEKVKLCDYVEEVQGHALGPGGSSRRELTEGPKGPGADVKAIDEGKRTARGELKSPDMANKKVGGKNYGADEI